MSSTWILLNISYGNDLYYNSNKDFKKYEIARKSFYITCKQMKHISRSLGQMHFSLIQIHSSLWITYPLDSLDFLLFLTSVYSYIRLF